MSSTDIIHIWYKPWRDQREIDALVFTLHILKLAADAGSQSSWPSSNKKCDAISPNTEVTGEYIKNRILSYIPLTPQGFIEPEPWTQLLGWQYWLSITVWQMIPKLNSLYLNTYIILQFLWVRSSGVAGLGTLLKGLSQAAFRVLAGAGISFEGSTGEGCASKIVWLLAELSS